jgi:uncharacterized protein with HEPN domain
VSPRNWQERIRDILVCANNIALFTEMLDFNSFVEDPKTIRAVAFELTTIGEAAKAIPIEIQEKYKEIPWGKIQGIRNVLVHEYFRLDEEVLWKTVKEDIPSLITSLTKIIQ